MIGQRGRRLIGTPAPAAVDICLGAAPVSENEGMPTRVGVSGDLVTWARERSGIPTDRLTGRFPKLDAWEREQAQPTLKQLEAFARATHTPIGYFFLATPPAEQLPLPDFRTFRDEPVQRVGPDLLETIYDCQQRQEWYREYALLTGEDAVGLVGSLDIDDDLADAAAAMRQALHFDVGERGPSWAEAFRRLSEHAEDLGMLVMVSGIVGSNTHRRLDPVQFRGFALADAFAPLVFVNGADTKAAQIFTLAHELAHLWLGHSALDNPDPADPQGPEVERWCNAVAAEMLIPAASLAVEDAAGLDADALDHLAARFRVSTLVVLRRLHDCHLLSNRDFWTLFESETARVTALLAERLRQGGGNFYNTQPLRASKRLARALIADTLEGRTLYRDAFRMLGLARQSTFDDLARHLGVA